MELSLHRVGTFQVNPEAEDSAQCGFKRGDRQLWYDVIIESDSQWLDKDGFVLDNNDVQHYFEQTYAQTPVFRSCETIAIQAVDDLCQLMAGRCTRVCVEIKPGDYAGIRAERKFNRHKES